MFFLATAVFVITNLIHFRIHSINPEFRKVRRLFPVLCAAQYAVMVLWLEWYTATVILCLIGTIANIVFVKPHVEALRKQRLDEVLALIRARNGAGRWAKNDEEALAVQAMHDKLAELLRNPQPCNS